MTGSCPKKRRQGKPQAASRSKTNRTAASVPGFLGWRPTKSCNGIHPQRSVRALFVRFSDVSPHTDCAVVDSEVESAFRIAANPGLVPDRRPLPTVVGKREQGPCRAPEARDKLRFHSVLPSAIQHHRPAGTRRLRRPALQSSPSAAGCPLKTTKFAVTLSGALI